MSAKSGSSRAKKAASAKKRGNKEEPEDPAFAQLRMLNEDLQKENSSLKETTAHYHQKLQAIIQHVLDINVDNYKPGEGLSLVDIPESDITTLVTNLTIAPSSCVHGFEVRLEELETRLTHMNIELAKLLKLKLKIEKGLKDMEKMYTVEDLKVNAKRMWYDSCSTHICATQAATSQNTSVSVVIQSPRSEACSNSTSTSTAAAQDRSANSSQLNQELIPTSHLNVLSPRAQRIVLTPGGSENEDLELPEEKMPGETHIFDMHLGLRSLVIRELSKYKGNGSDWRLMATRVGIPESLIDQWIRMRAPNAMALVMKVWGDSAGATVRMLHRHLVSPQMKAVVLAKRISDFYDVD